jgi:hypothetical protein
MHEGTHTVVGRLVRMLPNKRRFEQYTWAGNYVIRPTRRELSILYIEPTQNLDFSYRSCREFEDE